MPLPPGTHLGRYEILALIGTGGMGEVYRSLDPRMERTVAIKVSAEQFTERFDLEVRAVAATNWVERVLGRKPISLDRWAAENAVRFC